MEHGIVTVVTIVLPTISDAGGKKMCHRVTKNLDRETADCCSPKEKSHEQEYYLF